MRTVIHRLIQLNADGKQNHLLDYLKMAKDAMGIKTMKEAYIRTLNHKKPTH